MKYLFFRAFNVATNVRVLAHSFGGSDINVTKVAFTSGTVDPWIGIGMTKSPNADAPVFVIPGK